MSTLNDVLENNIKTLINSAKAVDGIEHQGLKGTAREEYLAEFLEKYLPHQWGIGKGQVQDSLGAVSNESDLIIYDRNSLPPTLIGKSINIFPIECVRYVFEVKSTLRSGEVKDSVKKFVNLKSLYVGQSKRPIRVLFGFDSDLTKKSELERVKEIDEDFALKSAIDVLIVIGKGYWSKAQRRYKMVEEKKTVTTNVFYRLNPSPDVVELKSFLFALLNTLNPELPSFSNYFKMPAGVDGTFHEEYQFFVKEEPFDDEPTKEIINLNINSSLIISRKKEKTEKRGLFSFLKKKSINKSTIQGKYIINSDNSDTDYSIPLCKIDVVNNGNEKITIKDCTILTSEGLKFFIIPDEEEFNFPFSLNPSESKTITSGFLCFRKKENSKTIGGHILYRKGDFYGNHFYDFKDKMRNIDYGVIELNTINGGKEYSKEFSLSDFLLVDENKNLDFILDYNGLTRIFSGDLDYIKQIVSNHSR